MKFARFLVPATVAWVLGGIAVPTVGADPLTSANGQEEVHRGDKSVSVTKPPPDLKIETRLQRILQVTGWFQDLKVTCREGVVTLHGQVSKLAHSEWAEALARDTDEVVAVINEIEITRGRWFDLTPAERETENLAKRAMAFIPYFVTSLVVLIVFTFLSLVVARFSRRTATKRMKNILLVELVSRLAALPVLIIGLYLVLRVCGLTGIAVTVLGGTGALGLVAGFAMKNILENYFSGVMLSLRNPYTTGDVIQVAGQTGVVQKLTTRGTILVDYDGNHIIIPNTTIYGNIIVNQSANPKSRVKFNLGLSYGDSTKQARRRIVEILNATDGVLQEPEPTALITEFQAGAVMVTVYFWIDASKTSDVKLKSLVMENIKETLSNEGFVLPGDVRQLTFPSGIPSLGEQSAKAKPTDRPGADATVETHAEQAELLREASKGREIDHGNSLKMPPLANANSDG